MPSFALPGASSKDRLQTVCLFRFAIANRRGDGAILWWAAAAKAMTRGGCAMAKDLSEDYRSAGFGGPLAFGARPALIVVDMVRAYFDRGSPLYAGVESTLESALRVLASAREARLPIVLTGVRYTPCGIDGGVFYRKVPSLRIFDEGSPLGRFAEGIEPRAGEFVIIKQYASAFWHLARRDAHLAPG
jgi:hypothetical protein